MKNTSASFVKLGIVLLPQILLVLTTASVKAELVADTKKDLKTSDLSNKNREIKKEKSTNQIAVVPSSLPNPVTTPETTPKQTESKQAEQQSASNIIILSPTVGTVLDAPAATLVIQMPMDSKIEVLVNGKAADASLIGRSELNESAKTVTQTWYGVPLQAGDNQITVRAIGAATDAASVNFKVRGAPVKLQINTLESRVPADGRSYATVNGQLVDDSGNRSNWDAIVTLEASAGEFTGTDFSKEQPGFQVEAKQGKFNTQLRSGLKAGTVTIRAIATQMEAFTQVQFETDLRPSLVTGVIDLRIGARGTDFYRSLREFAPIDRDNRTQVDLYAAVFGTGRVGE